MDEVLSAGRPRFSHDEVVQDRQAARGLRLDRVVVCEESTTLAGELKHASMRGLRFVPAQQKSPQISLAVSASEMSLRATISLRPPDRLNNSDHLPFCGAHAISSPDISHANSSLTTGNGCR